MVRVWWETNRPGREVKASTMASTMASARGFTILSFSSGT